jgi:hypothetical protein
MLRRLFPILSALSLLLSVSVSALWAASRWRSDVVGWDHGAGHWQVTSGYPGIFVFWMPDAAPGQYMVGHQAFDPSSHDNVEDRVAPGVYHYHDPGVLRFVGVAHWLLFALLAGGAIPFVVRCYHAWGAQRASKTGHCPTCGYDLRATPDRCPECGRVAAEKHKCR